VKGEVEGVCNDEIVSGILISASTATQPLFFIDSSFQLLRNILLRWQSNSTIERSCYHSGLSGIFLVLNRNLHKHKMECYPTREMKYTGCYRNIDPWTGSEKIENCEVIELKD
jgi:hypothetical protein